MRNDTPGSGFSYCILSWSGMLEYYTSFVKISAKRMPDFFLYIEHPVAKDALPHVDRHSILAIFRELLFLPFPCFKSIDVFVSCVARCFGLYAFRKPISSSHRSVSYPQIIASSLVGGSGGLAGLELLEVPVADLHVAAVVVHALGEALDGAGAVVVLLQLLLWLLLGLELLGRGLRRAAAEETANGVADGRADSDTTEMS